MDARKTLTELLADYFHIGDSYHYILKRVKEAFHIGTMTTDDFQEYDEDTVAEIAEHLIENGVTIKQWIPVAERLPEHCVNVLSYNGVSVQMDFYDEGFECWCSEIEPVPIRVTHWMPVPLEPPKEV